MDGGVGRGDGAWKKVGLEKIIGPTRKETGNQQWAGPQDEIGIVEELDLSSKHN